LSELLEKISAQIYAEGTINFARFMELALYCPVYGFYAADKDTTGTRGDFYTSVSVGQLFGELLAFQFAEWLLENNTQQIVEAGAHDGQLASDILTCLRLTRPEIFDRVQYWIVEPSLVRQQRQQRTLKGFLEKVRWVSNFANSEIQGIIFSNELLDAMPVHRCAWDAHKARWFEWGVALRGGQLEWARMEPDPVLLSKLELQIPQALARVLPDGFVVELSAAAEQWWFDAATALRQGKLLTFDYGLTWEEVLIPERTGGTLRAYHQHRVSHDVLALPGMQDITASVNFSVICAAGESAGLKTEPLITQAKFLTQIAARMWASSPGSISEEKTRQFRTLTHPEHLGQHFRLLVQVRQ
jgi:SAM-dependent MidA family methyltransferase